MDTGKIASQLRSAIDELRTERDEIENKIGAMEQALRELGVKRGPGRPRGSGKKAVTASPDGKNGKIGKDGKKVTKNWSPEARKAAAERMKRYWAERRKAAKKS